jgi:DNA-binding winged helix-turn-helix (wHTH) protein
MVFRLGPCRIDADRRELIRDGKEQHLSPKAFDLLIALLSARPTVVTKDQLMSQIWPGVYVAECNLPTLIAEIRTAIGDSARAPRFIKTHFSIGYSFIGEVSEMARTATAPPLGPTSTLRIGQRRVILGQGESTVGRDAECDVVINDSSVSRHHATIVVSGRQAVIRDLDSKNGTRVGGVRITAETMLESGEVVTFGSIDAEFVVEVPSNASTQTIDITRK